MEITFWKRFRNRNLETSQIVHGLKWKWLEPEKFLIFYIFKRVANFVYFFMYFSKIPHLLPFRQHLLPKLDPKMHRMISWIFWKSIFYCRLYSNRSLWVFKLWSSEIVHVTFIFQEEFDEMLLARTRVFTARQNLNLHQLFNFLLMSIGQTYQFNQIWAPRNASKRLELRRFWAPRFD